jgi:hypothetical protein
MRGSGACTGCGIDRTGNFCVVSEAFKQGLPAPVVGAMAENAFLFLCYNQLQSLIRLASGIPAGQKLSLSQLAMAAGGAGAVASFLL